jgi:Mg2+-importing ATPase
MSRARRQTAVLPDRLLHATHAHHRERREIRVSPLVLACAPMDAAAVYARVASRAQGLSTEEAAERRAAHGPNVLARDRRPGLWRLLLHAIVNPLVLLLAVLASISFATGDARAGTMMAAMIALGVGLKLTQEARAGHAAARLSAMISVSASVARDGRVRELPVAQLVPGDVLHLAAGDMIPADVRIVQSKDLFVSQAALTGESLPVEKHDVEHVPASGGPSELATIAFLGTSIQSGSAIAVVLATGQDTYLGGMASSLSSTPPPTAFAIGIARFTWLILALMAVMVPLVFVVNGLTKHDWVGAFFFAVAVAVGLTPEMLPMIVTVCLSKGAIAMGRKKVIVKRLDAIQNLGSMNVLCADKTGTLTQDVVTLERHCDVALREDEAVLALAYANSYFQTGLKSVLDHAVLAHENVEAHVELRTLTKIDEIPFDFERRIMSVVVRTAEGQDRLIAKGAPEAIFGRCAAFELDGERLPMDHAHIEGLKREYERLSNEGFRVLAIATRELPPRSGATPYAKCDECDLVLRGYVAFLDPPKETVAAALRALAEHGVAVKVLTGDNELVARKVCSVVGLATDAILLGAQVEAMSDEALAEAAERTTLFARLSPADKRRIIKALKSRGHAVGFMGDGINDAPALHDADVGISVDTAVDIAKEAADIILLEKSLLVLDDGVIEGRKVFANIVKYVRMGASSNFGNMFSVLGASLFVPFLPMLPMQILANNLAYDLGQTAIPTDTVDPELIARPRRWDFGQLFRFIVFIGPCSSVFDYTTFFAMLYLFGCRDLSSPAAAAHSASLFQTGWFVESLLTQTLIIHVIRTRKIPLLQSRSSWALAVATLSIMTVGVVLPYSPLGPALGFLPLPGRYWPLLGATLAGYVLLTQAVKTLLIRRRWI